MARKKLIAVIGPNTSACTEQIEAFGQALGEALVAAGYGVVCGGMGGLMEAACRGAKQAPETFAGATVGILPGDEVDSANPWCDIVIPTGIGIARNAIVVRSGDAVVAVGGGAGTLSEIALAWQMRKRIICVTGMGGSSEMLAGKILDNRRDEPILAAATVAEVMAYLR